LKKLFLLRHAKSSWKERGLRDFDRPLNSRGRKDAPIMGERLNNRGVQLDLIISSPAKRAITTARIIADKINYSSEKIREVQSIYGASVEEMIQLLAKVENKVDCLMLVGHNPTFTMLAEALSKQHFGNIPTCGIVEMTFNYESWDYSSAGLFDLQLFDYPKKA